MTSYISIIDRIQRELAQLQKDDAKEFSKEASATTKANKARQALASAKTILAMKSKHSELERAMKEEAAAKKKRAELSKKNAAKSKSLNDYLSKQAKSDEQSRKKVAVEQKRLIAEHAQHEAMVKRSMTATKTLSHPSPLQVQYDFFVSHASEDKDDFVRHLVQELEALGAVVFYDEATLRVGDSLRRKIDQGLANSRFGIVVLSEHFFRKEWPARELDGLTALEIGGATRILPIWHKVSKDEVAKYSPSLADKLALNTSVKGVKEIAVELNELIK